MSVHKEIMRIAVPAIVSNVTVPLLSLVDLAIVGHLGDTAYIAAISVGGMVFNVMYWIFGFIRMGCSGLTSQAFGRHDRTEMAQLFARSMMIAMTIALLMLLLQWPILRLALWVMAPDAEVELFVNIYFNICVWGAPASMLLFALTGWFLGMQDSKSPMVVAIVQNVANIVASLLFVYVCGMKVEGVALGTLIAQYVGLFTALAIYFLKYRQHTKSMRWIGLMQRQEMAKFFRVNRDIFLRTVCLVAVFLFFTSAGSWQSPVVLAVNTLLMQFFMFFSYVMDGFAYAGEALAGKYVGANDTKGLSKVVRQLFVWGWLMTGLFTIAYFLFDHQIVGMLTDEPLVVTASAEFTAWTGLFPIAGMAAFVWDGVFVGITASRDMLLSSALATAVFFMLYFALFPLWENHALWLSFICYLATRGISQTFLYRRFVSNHIGTHLDQ